MYYCAPGNDPAKGHVMTVVETEGVWSVVLPEAGVHRRPQGVLRHQHQRQDRCRKWINAWIVPTSSLAANGGRFDFADAPDLDPEQQVPGPDDFHFKYFSGSLIGPNGFDWWEWHRQASESATRFTQCVEQTAPGQLTYTRDFPVDTNGDGIMDPGVAETDTRTGPGEPARRPVRVIFQDGSYNPDKHGGHRRHHLALGQHHHQLNPTTATATTGPTSRPRPRAGRSGHARRPVPAVVTAAGRGRGAMT